MAPVIWLSVTVASVVATCVIRFGNTRCAPALVMRPAACAEPARFVTAGGGPGRWPVRAAAAPRGIVAGLSDVQLVAQPELLPLDTPPGVGVIRRGDPGMAGRETIALRLFLPPLDHLLAAGDDPGVVLHQ